MANKKIKIRWIMAIVFVVLAISMMIYTIHTSNNLSARGISDIPYNELTKASIDGKLDISKILSQISLLFIAALWGLIIAKKDEAGIVLSGNPELITFICASLLLIFSLVSHIFYLETISNAYSDAGMAFNENKKTIMDLFDPKFDYLFKTQTYNLISGGIVAVYTLFSAHKLSD